MTHPIRQDERMKTSLLTGKKSSLLGKSLGAVDLHIHGAYGIDLMSTLSRSLSVNQLQQRFDNLSSALWEKGVAGFCPTTVSSSKKILLHSVRQLGLWIRQDSFPGAKPLGIHLEGPFIHPHCRGAHPKKSIRPYDLDELEDLWRASLGTLKIITLAPETLSTRQLRQLVHWSHPKKIHLSIGHSQASEELANRAFQLGMKGVTHAWNALPFHHRNPGVMGAALGKPGIFLELILDQIHVAPTLLRWTLNLHPSQSICLISDCLSAGGDTKNHPPEGTLGNLKIHFEKGACRETHGQLAGGGVVLTDAYCHWLEKQAKQTRTSIKTLWQSTRQQITLNPLLAIRIPKNQLSDRQVQWFLTPAGKIHVIPIDSTRSKR